MSGNTGDVESGEANSSIAASLSADDVVVYLANNPDFFTERSELLEQLSAPSRWDGDKVVDLQSVMLDRLRDEGQELRDAAHLLVNTTRSNMLVQTRTHAGVIALLGASSLERLLHVIHLDLPLLLDVDTVALCLETGTEGNTALGGSEIRWLAPGTVDQLIGAPDKPFALLEDTTDDGKIFGEAAGLVRAAAYVRITPGSGIPSGVLALGSRERGSFHPGQGSDLLNFLTRVTELCLHRWLPGR